MKLKDCYPELAGRVVKTVGGTVIYVPSHSAGNFRLGSRGGKDVVMCPTLLDSEITLVESTLEEAIEAEINERFCVGVTANDLRKSLRCIANLALDKAIEACHTSLNTHRKFSDMTENMEALKVKE